MLYTDAVNSKDHHQKQSLLLHQPASQPASSLSTSEEAAAGCRRSAAGVNA